MTALPLDVVATARGQVLDRGVGLTELQALECLPSERLPALQVPLNFLNPRPGTPFGDLPVMATEDALRAITVFRLVLPRTVLRFAGGREITLGELSRDGMLGGINAVIVGNYLTTLGRPATQDLDMLAGLGMPLKALGETF